MEASEKQKAEEAKLPETPPKKLKLEKTKKTGEIEAREEQKSEDAVQLEAKLPETRTKQLKPEETKETREFGAQEEQIIEEAERLEAKRPRASTKLPDSVEKPSERREPETANDLKTNHRGREPQNPADVLALVIIAKIHEDAMRRMKADNRDLLEFFTNRLFEQKHRTRGGVLAEALQLEQGATFKRIEADDQGALLETIVRAKPNLSLRKMRSPKHLAKLIRRLVLPACAEFPGGLNWLLKLHMPTDGLDLVSIEQRFVDELSESERNKVKMLLSCSAMERSCRMLQLTSVLELEAIFRPLFYIVRSIGLACPKPELRKTVLELKKRKQ